MFIKIYFNQYPLIISDEANNSDIRNIYNIQYEDLLFLLKNGIKEPILLTGDHIETLIADIFRFYYIIKAGGGLVLNDKNEILMIYRRGKWDLPKGKLDKGETIEECAIREVTEETGLKHINLLSKIIITYHTYKENDQYILKESHWYKMQARGNEVLIPQEEEQITDIQWVRKEKLGSYLNNSFPIIQDIIIASRF